MYFRIAFLALGASCAMAQIGTSTITGRVTDASGAAVPGVSVTVVQVATNLTSNSVTNVEGIYRVLSLQPGEYRVTFEAQGFKKSVNEGVVLRTGDTLAVDAVLQVGNVTESVEVTGATPLLETETSAAGTVMSGNVLYEMPLYQRYINSTLNLVPGMSSGGYAYGGSLGAYHLAGQRAGAIGIFEDGVTGNDQQGGTETIKPIQNAVAEVKVITTVPPAEYGHSAGGVISVVKKSGTNDLHGMASFYGRTRMMQHRRYFDQARSSDPSPGRPNGVPVFFMQPDANIGGPVFLPKLYDGRNKTFFFFAYQRLHEKKVAQLGSTTPTPEMRAGDFNFPLAPNGVFNRIFDPASTRQVNGAWQRDPFPGNVVPASRFDPVAVKMLGFDPWVQPNRTGVFNANGPSGNYLADEFAAVFFNDYSLRVDHQFTPGFKVYGSYTDNRQSGFGRPHNIRPDRPDFDHVAGNWTPFQQQNMSFGKTWILSPSLVNDARVGYYRRQNLTRVPGFGKNWAQQLGIPNVGPELMPAFGTSSDRNSVDSLYGLRGVSPSELSNKTVSFRNDLSHIRGTHALKFGYELLSFRLNSIVEAIPVRFNFAGVTNGLQANGATAPNTGNTFAGFLTGYVQSAVFQSPLANWQPRSAIHSFYIQDDWKVTPTLTANLGLRYSNESPFNTLDGAMSNFDPAATDPVTGRRGSIIHPGSGLNRRDNNNFNPRVGLAWHPLEKWVFRGGLGMYTVDVKFPASRDQFDEYQALANQEPLPGNPTPIYQISRGTNPAPFNVRQDGSSPFVGTNFSARNAAWWDPNLRNPYTLNWNMSVQYEFTRNYLLDLSYQGSSGVGLVERWQANTFPVDFAANDPALRNQAFARAQDFRPYPHFGNVLMRSNFGHSTFHSGTVKVEKRMSTGLFFNTFYTYAKAINSQDNDNSGSGVAPIQNRGLEKGRAGYDRTHRWVGTINYELPVGRGRALELTGWMNTVLGGWELSWIQTVETGNPLTFSYAGSPFNYFPTFAGNRRPDLVGTPAFDFSKWNNGGPNRFVQDARPALINMDAFAYPGGAACNTFTPTAQQRVDCAFLVGNSGRNILTGPRLLWSQVSAQKNFRFGERMNAQLRWDFQNALKTYNFTGPTTTVNLRAPQSFGKLTGDPATASLGGQPLMNITIALQF